MLTRSQIQADARLKHAKAQEEQEERRTPHHCEKCQCNMARTGCLHCSACENEIHPLKATLGLFCQGCPSLVQEQPLKNTFRWSPDFPDFAEWCEENLELEITKPSSDIISRWVVKGWKGETNTKEMKVVSSMIPLFDVADCISNKNCISGGWNESTCRSQPSHNR
jgi:hypothetical protein